MENEAQKKKDFDPQKDFVVEIPQIVYNKNSGNPNKIKINYYEKGKFLGKGGFAKCFEMKCCQTKCFFAEKIFEKKVLVNAISRKKLISEIKLHKKL